MANFANSKINQVHFNSSGNSTGAITTGDISSNDTSLEGEIADGETDPSGETIFTVSRLDIDINIIDLDVLRTETMDNGNTVETAMAKRNKIFVKIDLEGGSIADSQGNTWLEVRPTVEPNLNPATDDRLTGIMFSAMHTDHSGAQLPN